MLTRLVITGYKAHELGIFNDYHPGIPIIKKALQDRIIPLLEDGLEWVILSGQLGVETWAAEVIMDLQMEYPELKYAIMTPFLDQEKNWNESKQEKYEMILSQADFVTSLTKRPYEAPWQFTEKNKFFLKNSDGILIVYDEEKQGSPKYIKKLAEQYASNHDYEIFLINAYDLQIAAEEEQMKKWEEE
ncbi:SLOG family protein [Rummeliibacillus sp. SL167]|uniref:SLOG family protein n=1 Tax=Rummeliibacillus sp. SL167 TaxID=2579792 RepID=UPI0011B3E69B|nr:DUF1273 domain-containing protein [Rummeliibacillus sp. SL167]